MTNENSINTKPYVLKSLLDRESLLCLYRDIAALFDSDIKINCFRDLTDLLERFATADKTGYLVRMRAATRLLAVKNVLSLSTLQKIAQNFGIKKPVMFSNPVLHVSSNLLNTYGVVDAHQDWPSTLGSYNSLIVWINLGGVTKTNGGLYFYENDKNRVELLKSVSKEHVSAIEVDELIEYERKYYPIGDGDALIFGHFIPHESHVGSTRMSISLRIEDAADNDWLERKYEYAQSIHIQRKEFSTSELLEINAKIK